MEQSRNNDTSNNATAPSGRIRNIPLKFITEKRHEIWRLVTYQFIHLSYQHLLYNVINQLALGCCFEMFYKFWRVGIIHSGGVIGAALASSVFMPFTALSGASGAVFAILGALVADTILNWEKLQQNGPFNWKNVIFNPVARVSMWFFIVILDLAIGTAHTYLANDPIRYGFVPHMGGFVTGFLIGIMAFRKGKVGRKMTVFYWVCVGILLLLVLVAVIFNCFCERYSLCSPTKWT